MEGLLCSHSKCILRARNGMVRCFHHVPYLCLVGLGWFDLLMGFDDFKCFFPLSFFLIWPVRLALFVCCRLPVKTLQLEQTAVVGQAEEPSVVASRMLLVFSTLEVSLAQC